MVLPVKEVSHIHIKSVYDKRIKAIRTKLVSARTTLKEVEAERDALIVTMAKEREYDLSTLADLNGLTEDKVHYLIRKAAVTNLTS